MNQSDHFSSPSASPVTQTKAFSLSADEVEAIDAVRREERLSSDSAALRLLIRDGHRYRLLRAEAERELVKLAQRDLGDNKLQGRPTQASSPQGAPSQDSAPETALLPRFLRRKSARLDKGQ